MLSDIANFLSAYGSGILCLLVFFVVPSVVVAWILIYPSIKKRIRLSKIQDFEGGKNYYIVEKFTDMYPSGDFTSGEVKQLQSLLKAKGTSLEISLLEEIINRDIEKKRYKSFRNWLLAFGTRNKQSIVRYFLDKYGENYQSTLPYLDRFLKEEKLIPSKSNAKYLVKQTKKVIELERFEKKLLSGKVVSQNNIDSMFIEIDRMTGEQFEQFLGRLFVRAGYRVKNTPVTGDQGADLILQKFEEITVVQVKRYSKPVSNKAVQEVAAAMKYYGANQGIVVTNNFFTKGAKKLARANRIELIDRDNLQNLIRNHL